MLEQLRKSGASIAIYLIFGLLIVIFVINFAPNAGSGQGGGCMPGGTNAITIDGAKANQTSYKIAYSGNQYNGRQKVYVALEYLIRRELLAQAAAEHGIRVTKPMIEEEIKKGYFFVGGQRQNLGTILFDEIDGEKFFNYGKFKGWVNTLNVSVNSYYDEQARGLQAALMAEVIQDSVRVSREEALASYLFENNTVSYDVVQFSPAAYRDAMRLSDADVQRFLATHEDEVKKKWTELERTYKATQPALKVRSIFIAKLEPAKPADGAGAGSAATPGAGSGSAAVTPPAPAAPKVAESPDGTTPPAKPVGMPIEEAKAKLEAARAAITAGKQKFADAAKQLSTDETAKITGGDMGWQKIESAQMGDKAVNDAIKTLKPGEMTPVITTDAGAYLVMAEDKREGDLTYDQVKAELAVDLAKDLWSKEAAKRAALDGLAAVRAGTGKPLDQVFQREVNMEQEQRKMQEQIERMMQQQQKQGAIVTESANIPAAWTAEDPAPGSAGPGGSGGSPTPAGSAAPSPAAGSAAPAAGSAAPAAGSAAPAAGSAAPAAGSPAPSTTAPAAAPAADLTPTKDVLPAFASDLAKPKVVKHGPVPRLKDLPVLGNSKPAIDALFDEMTPGALGKEVYQADDGSYVILQLVEKSAPKVEEFDKVADQEIKDMRDLRAMIAVEQWLKSRCEALAKDSKIKPLGDLIAESDDKGAPLPAVYRPCMSFR
jgi:parvulin-like peptidyl-prolyl isomerase